MQLSTHIGRLIFIFIVFSGAVNLRAVVPAWWVEQNVVPDAVDQTDPASIATNYQPALLGQAKHMAYQAYLAIEAQPGVSAGPTIETLFTDFSTDPADNYVPLLIGQLKFISQPFYQRFDELGIPLSLIGFAPDSDGIFPWTDDLADDANYAPALLGQLKYVFSFDLSLSQDGDSIPDWWEYKFGTDPSVDTDNSTSDADGDGRLDATEYAEHTNPADYYDSALPNLTLVSGDGQTIVSGATTSAPIVVRVADDSEAPLQNAPLEIALSPVQSGALQNATVPQVTTLFGFLTPATLANLQTAIGPQATTLAVRTDTAGEIALDFSAATDFTGAVTIDFLARSGESQITLQALLTVVQAQLLQNLFAGVNQTFLQTNQTIQAAGQNAAGQISGALTSQVTTFTQLPELPSSMVKCISSSDHTLALTAGGEVYAWGDNFSGQLGLGDNVGRLTPTRIPNLVNVVDIAVGDGFSSFLVDNLDGSTTIWLAGNLANGLQAGGGIARLPVAAAQTSFPHPAQLAASGRHLLVRCVDGSVWGWGNNALGQVAPASSDVQIATAVQIIASGAADINTSPDMSMAILDNGELLAWGNTAFEQFAGGTAASTGLFKLSENVLNATIGNGFIACVAGSGSLLTAGLNDAGQLGRDTAAAVAAPIAPVTLPTADSITALVAGDRHLVYTTNASELYGFGDNRQGALGAGNTQSFIIPTLLNANLAP